MDRRHSPRDTHAGSGVWQEEHGRATSPMGPPQRSPIWPLSHALASEPAGWAPCIEMCVRAPGLTHGRLYTIPQAVRF